MELFYERFLILLTKDMKIFYVTIDDADNNLKENSILEKYADCSIKNYFFICQSGMNLFDFIKIEFLEERLFFEYLKTIELQNTELSNIIIPFENPN